VNLQGTEDQSPAPKRTPAKHGSLGKDEGGEEAHGEYSYPLAIGMSGYLQGHIRTDCTFTTNHCARCAR
jgi:hypothetical protein